jgi:muramoyltetrapeptide carboxypeptidase
MNRKSFLMSFMGAGIGSFLINNAFAGTEETNSLSTQAIIPPYLKPGDTVGITCPAGAVEPDKVQCCCDALKQWGLNITFGKTVGKKWQRFGGTDQERLEDFQEMIDDKNINAIIFGKGGYGTLRIIDKLDWNKFRQYPKWLVGYSDLTVVHLHVHNTLNICTLHGDMSRGFSGNFSDLSVSSIKDALFGSRMDYTLKSHVMNRTGKTTGRLIGGNLTMLNACLGSKSDVNTKGKILFIEDVSEFKYNIDRMMMSLKRSGKLDQLAGLIVGEFTAIRDDQDESFNMCIEEIIWDKVKEYNYPVCFHFPAGHIAENRALKMGVNHELNVGRETTNLLEIVPPPPPLNVNIFQS